MKEEGKFKVGDITNKGVVDKIYSYKDISINGELYDLSKHNIKLSKEGQTQEPVGGMLEKIATILYANKSDEGDEGSWINSEDFYKIADIIAKQFSIHVTGESEAERKFTLKEALDIWKACYDWHHDPESPDKKEYFKQTFGIDI